MKKELKWAALAVFIATSLFAANVYAAYGRNQTGVKLSYLLNGSPVYKGTIADGAPGTFTSNATTASSFTLDNTSLIMVQCDVAVYITNLAHGATNTTTAKSLKIAADEKFMVGMLQDGIPLISIDSVSGAANCKVFEVK
jgi:hypothetical protein